MIATTIPDALHICPGCENVASGELYCDACRHAAAFYDNLLTRTGYRAVGETVPIDDADSPIPPAPAWNQLLRLACFVLLEAWTVGMTLAVRFIWQHWK